MTLSFETKDRKKVDITESEANCKLNKIAKLVSRVAQVPKNFVQCQYVVKTAHGLDAKVSEKKEIFIYFSFVSFF